MGVGPKCCANSWMFVGSRETPRPWRLKQILDVLAMFGHAFSRWEAYLITSWSSILTKDRGNLGLRYHILRIDPSRFLI